MCERHVFIKDISFAFRQVEKCLKANYLDCFSKPRPSSGSFVRKMVLHTYVEDFYVEILTCEREE